MKRLHVHVAVDSLADSIRFYSGLFDAEPTVAKPDYAKWMLEDPRVNFAISQRGAAPGVNHLGIQVESADELGEMQLRLESLQTELIKEEGVSCCYAKSDKYWLTDPAGIRWETFHTLDSIPVYGARAITQPMQEACCAPTAKSACCAPEDKKANPAACC